MPVYRLIFILEEYWHLSAPVEAVENLVPHEIGNINAYEYQKAGHINVDDCHQTVMGKLAKEKVIEGIANAWEKSQNDPEIAFLR